MTGHHALPLTTPTHRRAPFLGRAATMEIDLADVEDAPTLEEHRAARDEDLAAEAMRALRRAESILTSGVLRPGLVGSLAMRDRFERCLARASRSPAHLPHALTLRARALHAGGRTEEAIETLKASLHHVPGEVAQRVLYLALADLHAAVGDADEAAYYARRASPRPPAPVVRGKRAVPPPPPRR